MAMICSATNAMNTSLHLLFSKRHRAKEAIGIPEKNVKHHALRSIARITKIK
jgi:hypothetical protein